MTPSQCRTCVMIALMLTTGVGLSVRLIGLQKKIYWTDECFSLLNLSGASLTELDDALVAKRICSPNDILYFQRPQGSVWRTAETLLVSEPEQMPLYVTLTKAAACLTGIKDHVARWVSCLVGTALIPLSYWLARELETHRATGCVGALLVSISPFHVFMAQEARLYTLWMTLIVLSSTCLVGAMKRKRVVWWTFYSVTLTLSLYTIVLTSVVILGHWLFALTSNPLERRRNIKCLALATGSSVGLFVPWVVAVCRHWQLFRQRIDQSSQGRSVIEHVRVWMESASYLVGDVMDHGGLPRSHFYDVLQRVIAVFAVVLLTYGIYRLARYGPNHAKCFLFSIWVAVFLMQVLPDLVLGGGRSAVIRYLVPAFGFGNLLLAIALWQPPYGLAIWRTCRRGVLVVICLLCAVSLYFQKDQAITWNRRGSADLPYLAHVINESPRPLILYPRQGVVILPLTHLLNEHARVVIFNRSPGPIPQEFTDYFFFSESGPPPTTESFTGFRWVPAVNFVGQPVTLWRATIANQNSAHEQR